MGGTGRARREILGFGLRTVSLLGPRGSQVSSPGPILSSLLVFRSLGLRHPPASRLKVRQGHLGFTFGQRRMGRMRIMSLASEL